MIVADEKVMAALNQKDPPLPEKPEVEEIEAEPHVDHMGEDALMLWVILSDSTEEEDLGGENVAQLKRAIYDRLLNAGINLFPYARLVKRSEYPFARYNQ